MIHLRGGHLLEVAKQIGIEKTKGLDVDKTLKWEFNDSLIKIPHLENSIIITNPPYLYKSSSSRKKINKNLEKYFLSSKYDDIYLIALDKMLDAQDYIVAIIPETFVNSNYEQKNRLFSLTVLEENPFCDTDVPILVACFDGNFKSLDKVKVYKNESFINSLGEIERLRLIPNKNVEMTFNCINGWLAVRCVDSTREEEMLRFDFKKNINYDWQNRIKVSSRSMTLIDINVEQEKRQIFIDECNRILNEMRKKTSDIILSPFKGNMKNGQRRRRLDFFTCRAIIEKAYYKIVDKNLGGLFYED